MYAIIVKSRGFKDIKYGISTKNSHQQFSTHHFPQAFPPKDFTKNFLTSIMTNSCSLLCVLTCSIDLRLENSQCCIECRHCMLWLTILACQSPNFPCSGVYWEKHCTEPPALCPCEATIVQNLIGECCSLEGIEDPLEKKCAVNGGGSK